jgi:hypothetical protein
MPDKPKMIKIFFGKISPLGNQKTMGAVTCTKDFFGEKILQSSPISNKTSWNCHI